MKNLRTPVAYSLISLNILLVFLSVFSDQLELPRLLLLAGKLHPLLLHFPVALILLSFLLVLFRNRLPGHVEFFTPFLLALCALTAVVTALCGLFLSREGGYDPALLGKHQWFGVGISLACLAVLGLYRSGTRWEYISLAMIISLPLLVAGSHFGGTLAHGEDYFSLPETRESKPVHITDSSRVFEAFVVPLLESRCYNCHNSGKKKGGLDMSTAATLLEGGKKGKLWVPRDPLHSHIMERLYLPEDDKKHMPPPGKPQLTRQEINLISEWIRMGSDMEKKISDYAPGDSFRILFSHFMPRETDTHQYSFPAAQSSVIDKLQSPYRQVRSIALGSPALSARFFLREGFSPQLLKELEPVGIQLVQLNCSGMPLKDGDLQVIGRFTNLESLILNGTDINGSGFNNLLTCRSLASLSLSGTSMSANALSILARLPKLRQVYCWNSGISDADLASLQKKFPGVHWNGGYMPDAGEILKLTPPLPVNEYSVYDTGDSLRLKHPMPGVAIRFTTDGSAPDSAGSPLYQLPIPVSSAGIIKAIAVKEGWGTSDTAVFNVFVKGAVPDRSWLLAPADKSYAAQGIQTLVDGKKGELADVKSNWLGFRDNALDARFNFNGQASFREIVISTARKTGAYIFPPALIRVWAGADSLHLESIASLQPLQPGKNEQDLMQTYRLPVKGQYRYFRIRVEPVAKLPQWHAGKKEKGWVFIDEIFFNR